tara:strand:+ start:214 stop:603 length:390 start_codon:yes stop_codon:yes gene_type:complete
LQLNAHKNTYAIDGRYYQKTRLHLKRSRNKNITKGNKMKVTHLHNRNGNKVKNQFVVYDDSDNKFFQSYDTIIVMEENFIEGPRKVYLDEKYWDYSVTTSKYRNIFLEESSKETAKKIEDGTYILTNLN